VGKCDVQAEVPHALAVKYVAELGDLAHLTRQKKKFEN
jgi:hypothetical protein